MKILFKHGTTEKALNYGFWLFGFDISSLIGYSPPDGDAFPRFLGIITWQSQLNLGLTKVSKAFPEVTIGWWAHLQMPRLSANPCSLMAQQQLGWGLIPSHLNLSVEPCKVGNLRIISQTSDVVIWYMIYDIWYMIYDHQFWSPPWL